VDENIPLVLYSWFEYMDEYVNYVVPFGFQTPCLSIYYGLHDFLVPIHAVDPLMFLPHFVIPRV
jgi:hypothetical protein